MTRWINEEFLRDEIEDCVDYIPDPYAEDASSTEEEPYVHWHDVLSCISLAALLASAEAFNVRCTNCRWFDDTGYENPDPEMPELRMGWCRVLGRHVQAAWYCGSADMGGKENESKG